jgi:hypothetical protein
VKVRHGASFTCAPTAVAVIVKEARVGGVAVGVGSVLVTVTV